METCVPLPSYELLEIQQLAHYLFQTQPVVIGQVMSLGKHQFLCQWTFTNSLIVSCHSESPVKCLLFSSSLILFFSVFLSSLHQLFLLGLVPLQFPLPDMVIATDTTLSNWAFYF